MKLNIQLFLRYFYSLPRLSQIGVTVEDAKENDRYTVKHVPFGKQMVFEYKNETEAEMYIVLDEHKHLVGAEIYADAANDLVNLLVFIINQRLTAKRIKSIDFCFPRRFNRRDRFIKIKHAIGNNKTVSPCG